MQSKDTVNSSFPLADMSDVHLKDGELKRIYEDFCASLCVLPSGDAVASDPGFFCFYGIEDGN